MPKNEDVFAAAKPMRRRRFRNAIVLSFGLFACVWIYRLFLSPAPYPLWNTMSDSCMVPGVFCLGISAVLLADYYGGLDGIHYSWRNARWLERKRSKDEAARLEQPAESFSDFRDRRRRERVFPDAWLVCGGVLTLLSILFAAVL